MAPLRTLALGLVLVAAAGCAQIGMSDRGETEALRVRVQTMEARIQAVESDQAQIAAMK
jgi:hypothetical protein